MNCYVYPWENQNWDRQSAKTMKAGLLLLLINRFFFSCEKKMWMGIVGFDVERLRELAIQLSDEKLFILYHIYNIRYLFPHSLSVV